MIVDTGPLVAVANRADPDHEACLEVLVNEPHLVVPGPVIAEATFLVAKYAGSSEEARLLESLAVHPFEVVAPTPAELQRAADFVRVYADLPLGATDAIVMACAEARNNPLVATLDRRHFSIVRPSAFEQFDIRP